MLCLASECKYDKNKNLINKEGKILQYNSVPFFFLPDIDPYRIMILFGTRTHTNGVKIIDTDGNIVVPLKIYRPPQLFRNYFTYRNFYFKVNFNTRTYDAYDMITKEKVGENIYFPLFPQILYPLKYFICGKVNGKYTIVDENFNELFNTKKIVDITKVTNIEKNIFEIRAENEFLLLNENGKKTEWIPCNDLSVNLFYPSNEFRFFNFFIYKKNNDYIKIDLNFEEEKVTEEFNKCRQLMIRSLKENNLYDKIRQFTVGDDFNTMIDCVGLVRELHSPQICNLYQTWIKIVKEVFKKG